MTFSNNLCYPQKSICGMGYERGDHSLEPSVGVMYFISLHWVLSMHWYLTSLCLLSWVT